MASDDENGGILNTRTLLTLVLSIIIIIAAVLGYQYLIGNQDPFPGAGVVAEQGDRVAINYTGTFEDGRVFDTSILSVAENDILYPKSLSFSEKTGYQPLIFTIGKGEVIDGFEEGVLEMGINQTKTIVVPPEKGYGDKDPSQIEIISLVEKVPMYTTFANKTSFEDLYYLNAVVGTTVIDADWGWNATVYFVDEDTGKVILKQEPTMGEVIDYNGAWTSTVIGINSATNGGEITIKHDLTPLDANRIYVEDELGGGFIVTEVDTTAGTATLDHNREVVGQTLIFQITLVKIYDTA